MAHLTLAQMVQQACDELGVPRPVVVANSTDQTARQLLAYAIREGQELAARSSSNQGWPILRGEYTFTVQSTGLIPNCSYTSGSNIVTIGTPPAQAPQVGWVISTSGGSNATGFPTLTTITAVNGSQITLSAAATASMTNVNMAFGQQAYDFPVDFSYIINQTEWDRGYRWQLLGPVSAQEWQVLKSGLSPTGPRRRFRVMEGQLFIDPVPYDTNTLVFEYYSKNWARSATGTEQNTFLADTDTTVLPDDLIILGIKWRFLRAKGLDYSQEFKTYDDAVLRSLSRAGAARTLPLNAQSQGMRLLNNNNVPDTGFGQ